MALDKTQISNTLSSRNRWFLLSALLNQHMMMFHALAALKADKNTTMGGKHHSHLGRLGNHNLLLSHNHHCLLSSWVQNHPVQSKEMLLCDLQTQCETHKKQNDKFRDMIHSSEKSLGIQLFNSVVHHSNDPPP